MSARCLSGGLGTVRKSSLKGDRSDGTHGAMRAVLNFQSFVYAKWQSGGEVLRRMVAFILIPTSFELLLCALTT